MSNVSKGRNSYDANVGNTLITFFNRNITPYATESGGPKFDLVPVTEQKDIMINHARIYAQQEYDRIMQLVSVLQNQADELKRRLYVTDLVYESIYQFEPVLGNCYWLVNDTRKNQTLLVMNGPENWNTGKPINYDYITQVKYMGDHTWMEIKNE